MASGFWSETDKPIRPGFYNRFKAAALARIEMGKRGVVAMPVRANWGPAKQVVSITSEARLISEYGSDMSYTAYKLGRLVLLGQPKELLLYRLVDGTEKAATVTLKAGESDVIKIDTKHPTTRKFKVIVEPNIVDDSTSNLTLLEGTRPLYEFKGLEGTANEIAEVINKDLENKWLVATSLSQSEDPISLDSVASQDLTGGNDGTAGITAEDYINAMSELEGRKFNGFCLDGITDQAIHTSVVGWVERNRRVGKKIRTYLGTGKDASITEANNKSKSINSEGVVNVGTGGILDDIEYSPAETACYIMGLGEGQDMKECLTNQTTVFQDVVTHLGHEEIEETILSGTLILRYDDGVVVVEDDVNTLTRYGQDQNEIWGNLRAIKFLDMVDEDTSHTGNRQYVGKTTNANIDQTSVLVALKKYFETLQSGGLITDFSIMINEELQANAASDEFYWDWDAKYINVMKKIFGTGHIR